MTSEAATHSPDESDSVASGESPKEAKLAQSKMVPGDPIQPSELLALIEPVYGGNFLLDDLEFAYECAAFRAEPNNRQIYRKLVTMMQTYPVGHIPESWSEVAERFDEFNFEEVEYWCGGMKQYVEERLLARAWDLVRMQRSGEQSQYREDLGIWPDVATSMMDWWYSDSGQNFMNQPSAYLVTILDQTDGDPLTQKFKLSEFEIDVETWVACVDTIDFPTNSNVETATEKLNQFIDHYYAQENINLRVGEENELLDAVMLWCSSAKGRIERRMVANLLDRPVLSPY